MEPIEVKRLFNAEDVKMTESARVTHELLVLDLASFTGFDSTITPAFATSFLTTIVAAEQVVADSVVIDQQVSLTESVLSAMDRARAMYGEMKYFVLKAFPSSMGVQGEIGLNDYDRARKSQAQMAQFLREAHLGCVRYQQELVAAGWNAARISEMPSLVDELLLKNTSQKVFMKQRPKLTEDRVMTLNECYKTMTQVMAAAQLVYITDFAKQKQFVFSPSSGKANDFEEFSGEVGATATALIATVAYDGATVVFFRNTGVASLTFCLSRTLELEGNLVALAGGATISKSLSELQANGTNLLVKNNDTALEGSYLVEVNY
jgi:hypothetical protein